jgi:uncharacterized spore protein YtfJ
MTTESQPRNPDSALGDEPNGAFTSSPGYDEAMGKARKAGASPVDGFVERLAERVGAKASVRAVFGEPIERDGITVIPVARVRWGFGGGGGSGPVAVGPGVGRQGASSGGASAGSADQPGYGTGGGGGASADPVGYLEIGPDGATFQSITDARPSPAFVLASGIAAAVIFRGLARLIRR